jgi:hypothetical protein
VGSRQQVTTGVGWSAVTGVFAYAPDATCLGSAADLTLPKPIVAVGSAFFHKGYWRAAMAASSAVARKRATWALGLTPPSGPVVGHRSRSLTGSTARGYGGWRP